MCQFVNWQFTHFEPIYWNPFYMVWWSKYYFDRLKKKKQWVAGLDSKLFIFIFVNLWKKNERIFAKSFARNYEKNNAWNIRHLVEEMFIPYTHQHIVLYWRLWDLYDLIKLIRFLIWKVKFKIDTLCPQTRTRRSRVLVAAHHVAFAKQGLV